MRGGSRCNSSRRFLDVMLVLEADTEQYVSAVPCSVPSLRVMMRLLDVGRAWWASSHSLRPPPPFSRRVQAIHRRLNMGVFVALTNNLHGRCGANRARNYVRRQENPYKGASQFPRHAIDRGALSRKLEPLILSTGKMCVPLIVSGNRYLLPS